MVMMMILALGILVASHTFTMRVEMRLGTNMSREPDMEWMARSGMELARFVLAEQKHIPGDRQFDAPSQMWAGGPLGTNEVLSMMSLTGVQVGRGVIDVEMQDLESRININLADEHFLRMTLEQMQVDPALVGIVADSLLDWMDPDEITRDNGAESDYYLQQPAPPFDPHLAKNGNIDHLSELLLVRGIAPQLYYGRGGARQDPFGGLSPAGAGFEDLFTTIGGPRINVNTASPAVLGLALKAAVPDPAMDLVAQELLRIRRGLDEQDGTWDDIPFRTTQDLGRIISEINPDILAVGNFSNLLGVQSSFFEATITVTLDEFVRKYTALLYRMGTRTVTVLKFHPL